MKLDEFISESIKAVIKGINDSQEFAKENGALINPHIGKWDFDKTETTYYGNEEGARRVSKINFDVAVTVSNTSSIDGGGGINIHALKLGTNIADSEKNETVSRIQFDLNVALPNIDPTE
jgi:hypothetical protein